MGYERYPRNPDRDWNDRPERNQGRDYGAGREYNYSGTRDSDTYGQRDYGHSAYAQRDRFLNRGSQGYGAAPGGQARHARGDELHGSYASDFGHRDGRDDDRGHDRDRDRDQPRGRQPYGRAPQGYDYDDRGFLARAGDEVRSWFGDESAEQRREADLRYDERSYGDRDDDYRSWRTTQVASLDRDYDEYRRENRTKFENEFATWRTSRQGQRDSLTRVAEHMDVVGSDGAPVGTVDKVRGDRILLTKSDAEAQGRHHSIPSRWIATVDTNVTLAKTAEEAKAHWRDEERNQAMFGDDAKDRPERDHEDRDRDGRDSQGRMLNRSFSGTY